MAHYTLILAAGLGARLKSEIPKQFLELNSIPIFMHSIITFHNANPKSKIFLALPLEFNGDFFEELCRSYNIDDYPFSVYFGGNTRGETVLKGLQHIHKRNTLSELDLVSIHDAARPFIKPDFILKLIKAAKQYGSAVPFIRIKNSLRKLDTKSNLKSSSCSREDYVMTQTPQVFHFTKIFSSYEYLANLKKNNTLRVGFADFFDDASVFELFHQTAPFLVEGEEDNIKITTQIDYFLSDRMYEFFKKTK